jgi:hypothetical protein
MLIIRIGAKMLTVLTLHPEGCELAEGATSINILQWSKRLRAAV